MKKILLSIFFAFYLAKNIYGASEKSSPLKPLTAKEFLKLTKKAASIEQLNTPTSKDFANDAGYFTEGLSPCFCFIFFDKETGKTLFLTHFAPEESSASPEKAREAIEAHLDYVLMHLNSHYFAPDSEEEDDDDDQDPLSESISIWVIGGKKDDSGNSIKALHKIAKKKYTEDINFC